MPTHTAGPTTPTPLRHKAEALLRGGTPPAAKVATTGTEALTLLHRMASDPESASAALKMLHELQVHQVELDLQLEQLEQTRNDLTLALDRYVERFDFAPVALLVVERNGKVSEANLFAADLLGVDRAGLSGRSIDSLVTTQSQPAILALLKRLCEGGSRESCVAQAPIAGRDSRLFRVVATVPRSDGSFLFAFIEAD